MLLQPAVNALDTKRELIGPRLQKSLWYNQEQNQIVHHAPKPPSSADIRADLEDLEHGREVPMRHQVAQRIKGLSKGEIGDEIKHQKVVVGHDVDGGAFARAIIRHLVMHLVDHQLSVAVKKWFLQLQRLFRKGWGLQAAHAPVALVVCVEDVDLAVDALVPPFGVFGEVAQAIFGEALGLPSENLGHWKHIGTRG